jgi:hypothetical protein
MAIRAQKSSLSDQQIGMVSGSHISEITARDDGGAPSCSMRIGRRRWVSRASYFLPGIDRSGRK